MHEQHTFREKLKKRYIEQTEKDSEELRNRTSGYNKYFENWLEYEITKPNGKKKILRVYDGAWYSHKLERKRWVLLKLGYIGLWLLAAALFLLASLRETAFNATKLALITGTITALALLLCGYQTAVYAALPRKMTIGQFNSGAVLLKRYSKIGSIVCGGMAAVSLAYAIWDAFSGRKGVGEELLCTALYVLGTGAVYLVCRIESKMQYDITGARPVIPKGAQKIKDRELSW